jgi:hypothetical protein
MRDQMQWKGHDVYCPWTERRARRAAWVCRGAPEQATGSRRATVRLRLLHSHSPCAERGAGRGVCLPQFCWWERRPAARRRARRRRLACRGCRRAVRGPRALHLASRFGDRGSSFGLTVRHKASSPRCAINELILPSPPPHQSYCSHHLTHHVRLQLLFPRRACLPPTPSPLPLTPAFAGLLHQGHARRQRDLARRPGVLRDGRQGCPARTAHCGRCVWLETD